MQQLLSHRLWHSIKQQAASAKRRRAAIAYVTQDLLGLRKGDLLVTDASTAKIKAGDTDAKLLQKLHAGGVALYSCPGLHAKVILLDDVAVIGSANMSMSSQSLVEAAMMTDSPSAVAGLEAFLEQLVRQSKSLDRPTLAKLAAIEVVRRGTPPPKPATAKISKLGSRVWIVGVYERTRTSPEEERLEKRTTAALAEEHGEPEDSITTIRWTGGGKFAEQSLPGDRIIRMWKDSRSDKKPASVMRPAPILFRQKQGKGTCFFLGPAKEEKTEVGWSVFMKAWNKIGTFDLKPGSSRELDPDVAEALMRLWEVRPRKR